MAYFPQLLQDPIFSSITGNAALNLLMEYPTPEQLATLTIEELGECLSVHSKNHLGESTAAEILRRASCVSRTPVEIESKALSESNSTKRPKPALPSNVWFRCQAFLVSWPHD